MSYPAAAGNPSTSWKLIELVQEGDPVAWAQLVHVYAPLIVRWASSNKVKGLTCPRAFAPMLNTTISESGTVVTVGSFSTEELHEYLKESVGPGWPAIPHDVRNTLKRPSLLASTETQPE